MILAFPEGKVEKQQELDRAVLASDSGKSIQYLSSNEKRSDCVEEGSSE